MSPALSVPIWLVALAFLSAVVGLGYFLFSGLRSDHATGDYHFTWGIGVVLLFLMGFAPGLVGLGLYLTVERGFPTYWLVSLVVLALVVLTLVSLGVETSVTATEAVVAPR
jgi:hypothetical protein